MTLIEWLTFLISGAMAVEVAASNDSPVCRAAIVAAVIVVAWMFGEMRVSREWRTYLDEEHRRVKDTFKRLVDEAKKNHEAKP